MGKDRQAEGTVLLCLVLRPCWPAGGVQSRPLKCCHAESCSHRYGSMVTMVTIGGDLQPGCLADRLLTGLGQPQINP